MRPELDGLQIIRMNLAGDENMSVSKNGSIWVLGLTGGIACGKSSAAAFLAGMGAHVIDADRISRALTAPGGAALPAIEQTFGAEIFEDGALNRRRLGEIVFADDAMRRKLEAIIHPLVQQQTLKDISALAASGASSAILDVPLLYETGMDVLCDEVWVMAVPPEEQLKRVMERDGLSEANALNRIESQMSLEQKQKLCDRVIWTNNSIQVTQRELETLWQLWLKKVEKSGKGSKADAR